MSRVINTVRCGEYIVDEYEWESTPRWRQFLGARPFRQWHHVHGLIESPGHYIYADASTGEEQ